VHGALLLTAGLSHAYAGPVDGDGLEKRTAAPEEVCAIKEALSCLSTYERTPTSSMWYQPIQGRGGAGLATVVLRRAGRGVGEAGEGEAFVGTRAYVCTRRHV
jgi:hypothetical protein